ncbi:MAG: 50S ribosomal protein L25/general stress protein Ctc [Gammaproteobacteria bacterium]|nr:MAG: 50S ribosomal protein L25/general stress protein Ctc [Gammaproteobacteria bacterium]
MSVDFDLNAQLRTDMGKGASRRLRQQCLVPAIVYGADKEPQSIALDHNEVLQHIEHEAFFSHILNLTVDGNTESVVLRDMQRHPAKRMVMHMDFLRVSEKSAIRMHVPLHFIGEDVAPGIKAGGSVSHLVIETEVSCLPKDLPEYLEVDLSGMHLGDTLHLSDIKLPEGVELAHGEGHDITIASVHVTRHAHEEEEEEIEGEGEEGTEEG